MAGMEKKANRIHTSIERHIDLKAQRHLKRAELLHDLKNAIKKRVEEGSLHSEELYYVGEAVDWFTYGLDNIHDSERFKNAMEQMETVKMDWPVNKSRKVLDKFKKQLKEMHNQLKNEHPFNISPDPSSSKAK